MLRIGFLEVLKDAFWMMLTNGNSKEKPWTIKL